MRFFDFVRRSQSKHGGGGGDRYIIISVYINPLPPIFDRTFTINGACEVVDWGDESEETGGTSHVYEQSGRYNITINGNIAPNSQAEVEGSVFSPITYNGAISRCVEKILYFGENELCEYAFGNFIARSNQEIGLPTGGYDIPPFAFYKTGIVFDGFNLGSVKNIGNYAFAEFDSGYELNIPNGCLSIGEYAFSGSRIYRIIIPSSITEINTHTFSHDRGQGVIGLTSRITLPNSIRRIKTNAFGGSPIGYDITYNGTLSQWDGIQKDEGWEGGSVIRVDCIDDV